MLKITTVQQLIECFEDADPSEHIGIIKSIEIPVEEFQKFATWKNNSYTRNCLARQNHFEFILLCWDKDASTPIHDHDGQNCWVYQAAGRISENRFTETAQGFKMENTAILNQGEISYMNDKMGYHSLKNVSEGSAMTLHIYVNPIDRCRVYNQKTSQFEVKEMQYDSMYENVVQ